jgi:hypothetical protein
MWRLEILIVDRMISVLLLTSIYAAGLDLCKSIVFHEKTRVKAMRRSPKRVQRLPSHVGEIVSSSIPPNIQCHQRQLKEPYNHESKPIMGSKTPDDYRRSPNGAGKRHLHFVINMLTP